MPAQLPTKMKTIQVKEFNKPYELSEIDVPTPQPHQVLVKIQAGGFCHTDCMVMENAFDSPLPVVASHEPAGVVVGVGADVDEFKEGDRVGCINFDSCCGEIALTLDVTQHEKLISVCDKTSVPTARPAGPFTATSRP